MKKVFTLCMALLALSSMPAMAQDDNEEIDNTFQFYHAEINGNDTTWTQLHDGDVYTANVAEEDDFGFAQIMSGLYVRNISSDDATARVHMTIQDLPSGQIQFCMLGQCNMYNKIGEDNAKGGIIPAGNNDDMLLEWTDITSHGTATITLQVNPAVGRTEDSRQTISIQVLDLRLPSTLSMPTRLVSTQSMPTARTPVRFQPSTISVASSSLNCRRV